MVDPEFIKWGATLGVGGILAAFMFAFYRKDIQNYTQLWKITADQMITIVKENTESNTKLISMIESMERNNLRRTDIAVLKSHIMLEDQQRETNQRSTDGGK